VSEAVLLGSGQKLCPDGDAGAKVELMEAAGYDCGVRYSAYRSAA
jgi:hypothetical protein